MAKITKTYKGRIVTRMRRESGKILLVFANARPGEQKKRLLVSEADWQENGKTVVNAKEAKKD